MNTKKTIKEKAWAIVKENSIYCGSVLMYIFHETDKNLAEREAENNKDFQIIPVTISYQLERKKK